MIIICNGMKRAGSTLQYNLIADIIASRHNVLKHGYLKLDDQKTTLDLLFKYSEDEIFHVIKTHDIILDKMKEKLNNYKISYVYRDLRDVALSLINKGILQEDIINILDKEVKKYYLTLDNKDVIISRYEDLYENPKSEILAISKSLDICLTEGQLSEISEKNKYVNIRNNIEADLNLIQLIQHYFNTIFKKTPKWLKKISHSLKVNHFIRLFLIPKNVITDGELHSDHISENNGEPNSWKKFLDRELVLKINKQFNDWLQETHYKI
jgi:hypothetical protein